jgi:hypothetical protein
MNIRMNMQSMPQQSLPSQPTPGGSKEEMSPSAMSPHHGMGSIGSPHHVSGVKPGNQQPSTQKPPPAVLQVVKQVSVNGKLIDFLLEKELSKSFNKIIKTS